LLESIEIKGAETPFYAKLDRSQEIANAQRLERGGLLHGANVWLLTRPIPDGGEFCISDFEQPLRCSAWVRIPMADAAAPTRRCAQVKFFPRGPGSVSLK